MIKKAVIPIAGLGTRFLPLSKIIPKEFFPLDSKPVIQYIIEEAVQAGIEEFIFVISPEKKEIFKNYILKYFREEKRLLSTLRKRKKNQAIKALNDIPKFKYKYIIQKRPLGDGDAVLRAEKLIREEPFLVLFGDDVSWGKEGMSTQLIRAFKKTGESILCLYKRPKRKLFPYGVPKVKKIKERLYLIEDLVEKPKGVPPSNFDLVGKYILTPDIFFYLKKTAAKNGEIILLNALKEKIKDGKKLLGFHVKGKWLECGNMEKWQKSFLFLAKNK